MCAVSCLQAAAQISKSQRVTQIKLESFGWEPIPKGEYYENRGAFSRNLWIDHSGRVLVGFTVRENYALATRGHPGRSFHILRFTSEGKVDLSLVLPTDNWFNNGIYLGSNDQIFARANDAFQLLENEYNKESPSWKTLAPCPRDCYISQSLSRRTLIVRVEPPVGGPDHSTYTILDASSSPPRVVGTCSQMAFYARNITDKFAYWGNYDRDDNLMVRFPFCDVEHYQELSKWGGRGTSGFVLNDETLLKIGYTSAGPVEAQVIGPNGQLKFSLKMPKNDAIYPYDVASDERNDRFAFMVNTIRGQHPRLDIGGHLVARRAVVYSDSGQELASIPIDTHLSRDADFSMSPDGHRLAVLNGDLLTLLEIE